MSGQTEHGVARTLTAFILTLKRQDSLSPYQLALVTAKKLRSIITAYSLESPKDVSQLIQIISEFDKKLRSGSALWSLMINITHRILHIIRDESKTSGIRGLHRANTISAHLDGSGFRAAKVEDLELAQFKMDILKEINELIDDEVQQAHMTIADQAPEHIHPNEVVLTFGMSKCVRDFLVAAHQDRNFEVFVVEAAPFFSGHQMAKALSDVNIPTIIIADSSIYAIMSRVNKVIIGTQLIMANGGLKTYAGAYGVCVAAQVHSVPVLVVSGLYKLSPFHPFHHDSFNDLMSPSLIIDSPNYGVEDLLTVCVPTYDYIPPELISLFITNEGCFNPFYIYHMLSENYSQEDSQVA